MKKYQPNKIEKKWQEKWDKEKIYQPNLDTAENPFYNLMMFPYPSAEGLHMGNMYAFVHSDAYGRYMRLKQYDVFEPIGLDGFGIHSENYALKINQHIRDVSARTEVRFYDQLREIGNAYDWSRTLETYKPDYYRWTQWLFLKMYEKGLAYRRKSKVNWCPSCQTVLSDEQVIDTQCERCDAVVEQKEMEQWFWRITNYAEKLWENLDEIDWSEEVKLTQRNWIGRSVGAKIVFPVKTDQGNTDSLEVFTTRPDTLFGCTYMVVSPDHSLIEKFKSEIKNYQEIIDYVGQADLDSEEREKTGLKIDGLVAINPVNQEEIPVFVANYILSDYGTGAIMAVPAHDQRDWDFAQAYKLKIVPVIESVEGDENELPYIQDGVCINSDFLNGLNTEEAKQKIIAWLQENNFGEEKIAYRLRDWCVSRQRYWGPPIPMIYCQYCGWVPVPEEELPVLLPDVDDFRPDGSGRGPLSKVEEFVNVPCPKCQSPARRETDVSDPFVDSSWYYLRFPCTDFDDRPIDSKRLSRWFPVDMYIGGREHSVLHLLYVRFVSMVLYELGYLSQPEPFKKFRSHGLLIKNGAKISKSRGNVVNPDEYLLKYGTDAVRLYLMFLGDMRQGGDWRDNGLNGMTRFINRVWDLYQQPRTDSVSRQSSLVMNRAIKRITEDLDALKFNTAISEIMIAVNALREEKQVAVKRLEEIALLLAPFAPHLAEELWQNELGKADKKFHSVCLEPWPEYDESVIDSEKITLIVQVNGKLRDRLSVASGLSQEQVESVVKESSRVQEMLSGQKIVKVAFVPDRIINFVTQ
jgi:leucyl-tRNA synthetase